MDWIIRLFPRLWLVLGVLAGAFILVRSIERLPDAARNAALAGLFLLVTAFALVWGVISIRAIHSGDELMDLGRDAWLAYLGYIGVGFLLPVAVLVTLLSLFSIGSTGSEPYNDLKNISQGVMIVTFVISSIYVWVSGVSIRTPGIAAHGGLVRWGRIEDYELNEVGDRLILKLRIRKRRPTSSLMAFNLPTVPAEEIEALRRLLDSRGSSGVSASESGPSTRQSSRNNSQGSTRAARRAGT